MSDTTKGRILRTEPFSHSRWRELVFDSGEVMQGVEPVHKEAIACFIHLSDIHICDAASPARLEFLDRIADPDSPFVALIPLVGTYRAQEFLTTQVFESMIAAANQISRGPLTGTPVDAVVITGDVVDNAQENELTWYKTILGADSSNLRAEMRCSQKASIHPIQAHMTFIITTQMVLELIKKQTVRISSTTSLIFLVSLQPRSENSTPKDFVTPGLRCTVIMMPCSKAPRAPRQS